MSRRQKLFASAGVLALIGLIVLYRAIFLLFIGTPTVGAILAAGGAILLVAALGLIRDTQRSPFLSLNQ